MSAGRISGRCKGFPETALTAARIIACREAKGPFASVDLLHKDYGMGHMTLAKILGRE